MKTSFLLYNVLLQVIIQELCTKMWQQQDQDQRVVWVVSWIIERNPCLQSWHAPFLALRPSREYLLASDLDVKPNFHEGNESRPRFDRAMISPFLEEYFHAAEECWIGNVIGQVEFTLLARWYLIICQRSCSEKSNKSQTFRSAWLRKTLWSVITFGCSSSRRRAISRQADIEIPWPSISF